MKKCLNGFLLMIQFMTRIPVNKELSCDMEDFRIGISYFPIIGLIVGGIQYLIYFLLQNIIASEIAIVIAVMAGVLLTGALHVDGLGDVFDAFYSFRGGKDKILEIMKDSRMGTYGSLAIFFDVILKIVSFILLEQRGLISVMILGPVIGRGAMVFLFSIGKSAKEKSSGNVYIGNCSIKEVIITFIEIMIIGTFIVGPLRTIFLIVSSYLIIFLFNKYCNFKIGGLVGDTLGAGNELSEILTLIITNSYVF